MGGRSVAVERYADLAALLGSVRWPGGAAHEEAGEAQRGGAQRGGAQGEVVLLVPEEEEEAVLWTLLHPPALASDLLHRYS